MWKSPAGSTGAPKGVIRLPLGASPGHSYRHLHRGPGLSLEDLLSEEPSAIDDFIRRKFAETKMTHLLGRTKVDCQINPPPTLILAPHQYAVVIAPQRPSLG